MMQLSQDKIIAFISKRYYKVVEVNLLTGEFAELKVSHDELEMASKYNNLQDWLDAFVSDGNVHYEDVNSFQEFANLKKIYSNLLENKNNISVRYRRIIGSELRWVKFGVLCDDSFSKENPMAIIYIIDIDDDIRDEIYKHKEFKTQNYSFTIIEALAKTYDCIYINDLKSGKYFEVSNLDRTRIDVPKVGLAREMFYEWINKNFTDENKQDVMDFTNIDTVAERLKNRQSINLGCNSSRLGWISINFIVVDRDEDGLANNVLFAGKFIDSEKQREIEAKEALEEAYNAARLANSAKTNFLARMSHDMRTLMNAVLGMSVIAQVNIDNKEKTLDCLSKIDASGLLLLQLINDLLDLTKIESRSVNINTDVFSFSEFVNDFKAYSKSFMDCSEHEFSFISNVPDIKVIGDKRRIIQILINIVSNAHKYTPEGGKVRFEISERPSGDNGILGVNFICEDTGIGISEENIDHIFEPFYQGQDALDIAQYGSGLGLPIARNLATMMGGDVLVESEVGKGSKFTAYIYLPIAETEEVKKEDKEPIVDKLEKLKEFENTDKTILVVEDNEINAEIANGLFSLTGVSVDIAYDGFEAIEKVKNNVYDLICMDIRMPKMDGYEAAKKIRSLGVKTPIVAMTANAYAEDIYNSFEAGMNDHMAKPISIDKIISIFEKWL
ncbi:MAG: response regulator [Oscillospiraceae bacterium]|nr:response regulator [Oscillospiraceae bacterium]